MRRAELKHSSGASRALRLRHAQAQRAARVAAAHRPAGFERSAGGKEHAKVAGEVPLVVDLAAWTTEIGSMRAVSDFSSDFQAARKGGEGGPQISIGTLLAPTACKSAQVSLFY